MKNKILENILIEERERLLGRLKAIEHRLKSLPSGWIREIKKENKTYKYLYQSKIEEKKQLKERVKELNKILELY